MIGNGKGDVLLSDVIDWGQGYDDNIIELLQAFKKFRDGYYELINYGDDWWKTFNQGVYFDEIMKEQWDKVESINFMNCVEKMAVSIAGTYVRFDEFVDGVVDAYNKGNGLRHDIEPQTEKEQEK